MRVIIPLALSLSCVVVHAPQPPAPAPPQLTAADKAQPSSAMPAIVSFEVTADVQKANTKEIVPVIPGQVLKRGDAVALTVGLDHDAYVYVMYVDARGTVSDLFPATGATIMHPGHQRLPPGKRWQLDELKGTESFIVFAADAPLDSSARRSRAARRKPPAAGKGRSPSPANQRIPHGMTPSVQPRPGTSNVMGEVGSRLPIEIPDRAVAEADADGVMTAVLTIDHR